MEKNFDKKQYDALNQRKVYDRFKENRTKVYESLGGKCQVCGKVPRAFHLHHVIYHPIESNYPTHSKAMNIRIKRVNEALAHPERFALLCGRCHQLVTLVSTVGITKDHVDKAFSLIPHAYSYLI